jgi:GTPase SAR1 family protein
MQLNQGQKDALASAMQFTLSPTERRMVIKGRAGTGKSTLINELLPSLEAQAQMVSLILQNKTELNIHLTATTNKASKVLADFTKSETKTIHSLLGLRIHNSYSDGSTKLVRGANSEVIVDSVIVIDEAFYTDDALNRYIHEGTQNCKIIFVGDPYQCAPVRQTRSPIEDLTCRTVELNQVTRNSGVLTELGDHWRDTVITGQFSKFQKTDPNIIWATGPEFQAMIDQEFSNVHAAETDNKIICWTNAKSTAYSDHVRQLRGLPTEFTVGEHLQIVNSLSKMGLPTDSIIQIKKFEGAAKMYGVSGRNAITQSGNTLFIPDSNSEMKRCMKQLAADKQWKPYYELQETVPDLRAVHACTVHKAQGSTYRNVFIDLPDIGSCNIASDVARMMHVAVTRPTDRIIFRGNLPAKYGG